MQTMISATPFRSMPVDGTEYATSKLGWVVRDAEYLKSALEYDFQRPGYMGSSKTYRFAVESGALDRIGADVTEAKRYLRSDKVASNDGAIDQISDTVSAALSVLKHAGSTFDFESRNDGTGRPGGTFATVLTALDDLTTSAAQISKDLLRARS